MTALLVTLFMFAQLAIGMPVGFALLVAGTVGLFVMGGLPMVLGVLKTAPASAVASYELITVPMFILMADLIVVSGIANSIFTAARTWVGRLPGGLAIATAIAGAGFGALSGSSTASAATLSATSVPVMLENGYEPRLATGVVAICGTLAMLIPPSIALVLYGIIAEVDIGALLIGGILPGLLVFVTIVLTVLALIALDPTRAPRGEAYPMSEKLRVTRIAAPVLGLFGLVTGLIYLGVATPTEASALGALGAFLLVCLSGAFSWSTVLRALQRAAYVTCMILVVILGAKVFAYFLALTQLTNNIIGGIGALDLPIWLIVGMILSVYLILGFFMDQIAILVLTIPIALPLMVSMGFDPVWFGVVVVVLAEVGLVTPPLGLNVFVVSKYTGRPLGEIFLGVTPHVLAHLIVIALLVAFPQIVLWLPSTM
jgi:tripartite ATP-independent transporter DctM subunit